MILQLKRAYEPPEEDDGTRILVDRLWPRGLSKADAKIDFWARELAPSNELRRWYNHDETRWPEFQRRYLGELHNKAPAVEELMVIIGNRKASLLFGSKEANRNNAAVLKQFLETML